MDPNYDEIVPRIQQVYSSCSKAEQQMLKQILSELANTGYSYTYEQLFLSDFTEVPVSIDQFICGENYLGPTNNFGDSVYDFWKQMFRNVFNSGNRYNEILLSGATRIGKTSSAVTIMAYMLYRLMLYRNPHDYFHKKAISRFTLAFANLTKDLAEGVAFHEFNSTLKASPWFQRHGTFTKSVQNPIYLPEGDKIDIVPASDAAHVLGMQVWCCLIGNTTLLTVDGICTLEACADTVQEVVQLVDNQFVVTPAEVKLTRYTNITIRIELENGYVIEGTPDHRVMLSDGSYKRLDELTSSDDLLTFNMDTEVDQMKPSAYEKSFAVYMHTSPSSKRYVGITCAADAADRWGHDGCNYKNNSHFWRAIQKYGWDNFQHEIIATGLSLQEACNLEIELIARYNCTDPDFGYNYTTGGNWPKLSAEALKHWHKPGWCKGLNKETDPRIAKLAETLSHIEHTEEWCANLSAARSAQYQNGYSPVWITNGEVETTIQEGQPLPEGYSLGRLNKLDTYIFKGTESKKINHADISIHVSQGWTVGRPSSVGDAIRKANQRMHWEYHGMRFESADSLASYLRSNGFPKIVGSTITSLSRRGFETSPTYKSLEGQVRCILHEN